MGRAKFKALLVVVLTVASLPFLYRGFINPWPDGQSVLSGQSRERPHAIRRWFRPTYAPFIYLNDMEMAVVRRTRLEGLIILGMAIALGFFPANRHQAASSYY